MTRKTLSLISFAALAMTPILLPAPVSAGGLFGRRRARNAACAVQPAAYPVAPAAVPVQPTTGDVGFVGLLNAARAQRGLAPLAHDPGLAGAAATNNSWQCARGLGHWAMSGGGQCSAVAFDAATALAQWAASGPHASILFDPSARTCGFAAGGGFATANVGY